MGSVCTSACICVCFRVRLPSDATACALNTLSVPPFVTRVAFSFFFRHDKQSSKRSLWGSLSSVTNETRRVWRVTTRSATFRSARRVRRSTVCRRSSRAAASTIKSTSRCSRICARTTCWGRSMATVVAATHSVAAVLASEALVAHLAARRSSSTTRSRLCSWVRSANPRARCSRNPAALAAAVEARPSHHQGLRERHQDSRLRRRT